MKIWAKWKFLFYRGNLIIGMLSCLCAVGLLMMIGMSLAGQFPWLIPATLTVVFLGVIIVYYYCYYQPYKETNRILDLFANGYLLQDAFDITHPFSIELENATQKFREMLNTKDLISISKKQAEYLALQNQINPHFLYNTLEGIRSEALIAGMDQIAEMTEALATFFRYTISGVEHLVSLEDELANIENYYIIQQFRFGDRLSLKIEYDYDTEDEFDLLSYRLPKLTLQPIVENSIFHGIEPKIGKGTLHIKICPSDSHLIIRISDDGLGIEQEKLDLINERLRKLTLDDVDPNQNRQGGIAMLNVSNRIKLLFGEAYGIHLYSTVNVGTDVEITLPLVKGG